MSSKMFSLMCVGVTLLLFGVVGLFNAIVDPFWYFRAAEIDGFNLLKPKAAGNERLAKAALVAKIRPEAVIVGNSSAEIGLPPLHAGFTQNGLLKSFNLGMQGADWSEVYCLALFALHQPKLKRLVVGVSGVDSARCPTDDELGRADYSKLLFSRTAFDASLDTLHGQRGNRAMTREGLWTFVRNDSHLQTDDEVIGNFALEFRAALCPSVDVPPRSMDPARITKAPPAPGQAAGLRQLIRVALAKKVELVLLFYPTHVLFNETGRRCDGPEAHWNWLWQAVAVADEEAGGETMRIQIWDFFGYGPLNAERLHAGKPMRNRLWQDCGHFNEEVGSVAFDAIFLGDTNYGARVTVDTFDQLVARTEEERQAFLATNEWVVPELNELVQRARAMPIREH
jgi:hypothetical protein